MNLEERIKEALTFKQSIKVWRNSFDSYERKTLHKLSVELGFEPLTNQRNCGCIDDVFKVLSSLTKEKIKLKQLQMESTFKLKAGKVIYLKSKQMHLGQANLTDDLAIALLSDFPGHETSFEKMPDNWKELVAESKGAIEDLIEKTESEAETTTEEIESGTQEGNEDTEATAIELLRKEADEIAANTEGLKKAHWKASAETLKEYIETNK